MDVCEDHLKRFIERFPLPLAVIQATGVIEYLNPQFVAAFGYRTEDLPTLEDWLQQTQPDPVARQKALARWRDLQRTSVTQPSATQTFEVACKDGRICHLLLRCFTPENDGKQIVLFENITEEIETERALRESESRFQAILDNSTAVIYLKDREGRYILVNRHYETVHDVSLAEIKGKTDYEIHPEAVAATLRANDQLILASRRALEFEEQTTSPNPHTFISIKFPLYDAEGVLYGVGGISTDITERKQAEAERERLLVDLQNRTKQLQTAVEVSKSTITMLDPEELLHRTVELIQTQFAFYYVGIFLVDAEGKYAELRAGTGEAGRQMLLEQHRLLVGGESMIGWCIAHSTPRVALDVGAEAVRFNNPHLPDTHSELALPLIAHGQVIGALTVQSAQEAAFSEVDIAVLQTMVDQVAIAIQNARLYEAAQRELAERVRLLAQLERRNTQLQTAAEVSKSAITILAPETLMWQTVNLIRERFDLYYVGIFLVDEPGEYAVLRAGTGEAGKRMLESGHRLAIGGESMIGWSIAHAKARIALDVGAEAVRFNNPYLPETRSEMALPLVTHSIAIGALTVQSRHGNAFSEEDTAVLQAMVDQLATAIENARLYEAARREISRRTQVEEEIRKLNDELEQRVAQRTAQLAATNKELEAFSYSVSHDLRSPLRAIDGFSLALLEDYEEAIDDIGKDYLRRVRAASQRMGQLIDDLLQLSRLTRGELRLAPVDLSALAEETLHELQELAPERQVEISIAPDLHVNGDARLLRIVLENLLRNAWKFTSKVVAPKIEVGVQYNDGRPAYFVRDNGAGFDMAYVDKLFGAFQRLHKTDEFEGTGIGLATVQRIIHRHGGRVWAEGEVDKGATFYFTL